MFLCEELFIPFPPEIALTACPSFVCLLLVLDRTNTFTGKDVFSNNEHEMNIVSNCSSNHLAFSREASALDSFGQWTKIISCHRGALWNTSCSRRQILNSQHCICSKWCVSWNTFDLYIEAWSCHCFGVSLHCFSKHRPLSLSLYFWLNRQRGKVHPQQEKPRVLHLLQKRLWCPLPVSHYQASLLLQ